MTKFEELCTLNVNDKTEKKKGSSGKELTYLSWAWAYQEFKKRFPEMTYEIKHWDGKPYLYDENLGYMVETSITANGETNTMWLPVMDSGNNAMKAEEYTFTTKGGRIITVAPATMFDINTTIMRCLVKNMAMFGLGLYIYAGEDLPETPFVPMTEEQKEEILNMGGNFDTICKYLKVTSIDQISFETADSLIKAKRNKEQTNA